MTYTMYAAKRKLLEMGYETITYSTKYLTAEKGRSVDVFRIHEGRLEKKVSESLWKHRWEEVV